MKYFFAALLGAHGLLHLLGFVKAFDLSPLSQLRSPIPRGLGFLWLLAALLFVASAALFLLARRHWWMTGLPALVFSQVLIGLAWSDAKAGGLANLIVLLPLALNLLDLRPSSLHSRFEADVRAQLARTAALPPLPPVTERDLTPLPPQVATWLRRAGVVGRPRVRSFRATYRAQMRFKPDAAWMPSTVLQLNFFDHPARLFFMESTRLGVPFDVFHRYVGDAATMEVRIGGVIPVVDARGKEMNQGETVTMLNDLCFNAPAALLDAPVQWEPVDARQVRATFTNAGQAISAVLSFDVNGDFNGFVSFDRWQSDGKTARQVPWSTPAYPMRDYGVARVPAGGEARWREATGEWAYARFDLERLEYNPR